MCDCKRARVQFITCLHVLYLRNDIFITDIVGYDRLKITVKMKSCSKYATEKKPCEASMRH